MAENGKKSDYKSELPIVIYPGIKSKIYDFYQDKKRNYSLQALGLYVYLYDAARRQNNIRVWLTDGFIRRGTGIGKEMLTNIKKDLIDMDLISIYHERKDGGKFGKKYIEIKYVWKKDSLITLFNQDADSQIEYKIVKALLKYGYKSYEQMKSESPVYFQTKLNDQEIELEADTFYFNDEYRLVADANVVHGDGSMKYTVPRDRAQEVMKRIASFHRYQLSAVLNVLKAPP